MDYPIQWADSKSFVFCKIFTVTIMVFASGVARGGLFVPRHSTRRERPRRGAGDSREFVRDRDRDRDHCFPGKILRLCSRRRCFGPLCVSRMYTLFVVFGFLPLAATFVLSPTPPWAALCFFCAHIVLLLLCLLWRPGVMYSCTAAGFGGSDYVSKVLALLNKHAINRRRVFLGA